MAEAVFAVATGRPHEDMPASLDGGEAFENLIALGYARNRLARLSGRGTMRHGERWRFTMMKRFGRWCEIVVGLFFLVGAAAKAYDMDSFGEVLSSYGVVKDPALVRSTAYSVVCVETLLGALLLSAIRLKGLSHAVTAMLTIAFSGLIFYAWRWQGLTDCGCVGTWIVLDPPQSLAKNIVLLGFLAVAWHGTRSTGGTDASMRTQSAGPRYLAVASIVTIVCLLALGSGGTDMVATEDVDPDRPLAKFAFEADGQEFNLAEGEYLVAMLNATCGHCQDSVEALNGFLESSDLPEMVGLIDGTDQEIDDFRLFHSPLFPLNKVALIDLMEFMNTPPALIYARGGVPIKTWSWKDDVPAKEEILDFVIESRAQAKR